MIWFGMVHVENMFCRGIAKSGSLTNGKIRGGVLHHK